MSPRAPLVLAVVLGLGLALACATTPPSADLELPEAVAWAGAALLDGARSARVVILEGDAVRVARGFGDRGDGAPPGPRTLYPVGSVSKLVTATLILQLVEEGALSLDAPLRAVVPEFEIRPVPGTELDPDAVTIRNLLHHHAGLPTDHYHRLLGEDRYDFRDYLAALKDEHLVVEPDTVSTYSNLNYTLLGIAAERATGQRFATRAQQRILAPAGMFSSTFAPGAEEERARARLQRDEALRELAVTPAGGLWSTADEVARFGRAALTHRLVSASGQAEMFRQQTDYPIDAGYHQGLGWYRFDGPEGIGPVYGHNGATPQYRATLLVAPERDLVVAVTAAGTVDTAVPALRLMAAAAGVPFRAPEVPAPELSRYVGRWQAGDFGTLVLEAAGERMRTALGPVTVELRPASLGGYEPVARLACLSLQPGLFRGLRYSFDTIDGEDLILNLRGGTTVVGGFRVPPVEVTDAWRARLGAWEVVNEPRPIFTGFTLVVPEGERALLLRGQFELASSAIDYALEIVDDTHARVAGRGRDLCMVLRAEDDGDLYFSGYRLRRARR